MHFNLLSAVLYLVFAPLAGGLLAGVDRKISARMQGRQGPSVLQSFYDLYKLLNKEVLVVNNVQNFLVWGFLIFTAFTGCLFYGGGDMLLAFFALTLSEIFFVMGASSANAPFSAMGSQRELVQMMAYEPMMLIAAIGFYDFAGSFYVADIVAHGSIPAIVYTPGIFLGFLWILAIKFRKSPFDISTTHHAHQEMVKGLTTDISGSTLALVELSHWYEDVFLLGVVALFIITDKWWSVPLALIVCACAYFIEILADNIYPRVKWDFMLSYTWIVTLVVGVTNVMILSLIR